MSQNRQTQQQISSTDQQSVITLMRGLKIRWGRRGFRCRL